MTRQNFFGLLSTTDLKSRWDISKLYSDFRPCIRGIEGEGGKGRREERGNRRRRRRTTQYNNLKKKKEKIVSKHDRQPWNFI